MSLLAYHLVHAECQDGVDHSGRNWNQIRVMGRFPYTKRLLYFWEFNIRFIFNLSFMFEENVNRFAIGYAVHDDLSCWLGTGIIPLNIIDSDADVNEIRLENRIWQQVLWKFHETKHSKFISRTRLEQRWRHGFRGMSWRLRQKITITFKNKLVPNLSPVFFNELFFLLNHPDWLPDSPIGQNRTFLGVQFHTSERSRFLIGYMNRYLVRLPRNRMNHVIWLSVRIYPN